MRNFLLYLMLPALLLLSGMITSRAETILAPGDIVIVSINGDADATNNYGRGFSFMPLVNLEVGTVINFTDYGWSDVTGAFITNKDVGDAFIHYTAPTTITAGTIIRCDSYSHNNFTFDYTYAGTGSNPYLNLAGLSSSDELLVFQGTRSAPVFICAATFVTTGWATGVGTDGVSSGSGSALPGSGSGAVVDLVDDVTALSFNQASGSNDNSSYSGSTTATDKAGWQARIQNYSNWTFNDGPVSPAPTPYIPTPPTGPFTVTGAAVAPTATTNAASSVTTTGATLNGSINANNGSTTVTFQYGTSISYGTTVTATPSPVTGSTATSVSYSLSGLTPNTTYHYRVVGVNTGGTTNGLDATFTTSAAAPTATTSAASSITSSAATLNGTINANNASTTVSFDYGLTNSYGTNITATPSTVTGTSATSVSCNLSGLTRNTTYHYRVKGVNAGGTTNGSDLTFTTSAVAPTITTQAVSSIASTTAIGNGNITDLGAPNPTAYGVCWNTTGTPIITDSKNDKGSASSTGAFTASITGLNASTTYYVRAFATNSAGTSYGGVQTFTTNAALPFVVEHFTDETAGTSTFTNSGFTFNLTGSKLIVANSSGNGWTGTASDDYYVDNYGNYLTSAGVLGSITNSLATFKVSELYVFPGVTGAAVSNSGTVIIRGKLSGATQYTYTLASGDINLSSSTNNGYTYVSLGAYSSTSVDQLEFELTGSLRYLRLDAFKHVSTARDIAATVTTQAVSGISTTTATGNGTITYLGQPNPTAYGVCWNTSGTPTISNSKVDNGAASATGAFTASMTGLSAGTTYHVRSFVTNNAGTSYGDEVLFTTTGIAPTVTTQAVSNISSTTATGNGNITNLGAPNPTAHGVCWNTTGTPTISDSKVDNGGASITGAFTSAITGLTENTTYHVRAYATNTSETSYGNEVTFTTNGIAPTVTTQAVTAITTNSATGNGNITNLGIPNPTAHGICWNTTGTPTTTDDYVNLNGASSTGAFSASMTGLSANTTYYVRAYATNTGGTGYGDEVSFTTIGMAANLTTGDIVILEFNGTGSDGFSFMPLVDLESGTTIYFTDYGWNNTTSSFHTGEEGNTPGGGTTLTYVAPTDMAAGTIIRSSGTITLNSLNTGHDGIIAYQGSSSTPTFLWAYHTGQWGKGSYDDYYWSDLPTGLTNGTNAAFFADLVSGTDITVDDGSYTGPVTVATPDEWRARVANASNWTTTVDATTTPPTGSYPVNFAPVATAPSTPTVVEDATNVALADDIGVTDADGDNQTVTFTITGGTVTLGTTGITFGGGGNGSASFTAAGTLTDINAALDAATFTPTANLNGSGAGKIEFTSNDGIVNSNTASVTFNISAVNDDPTMSGLPSDILVTEDVASNVDFSAATFSDVDAGSNSITLTIVAGAGTLSASSSGVVTIGGSGTTALILTGTASNIDTYLNTASNILYTGVLNAYGNDATTLTLTANDGGNTGSGGGTTISLGTVSVDITAVNDAPVLDNAKSPIMTAITEDSGIPVDGSTAGSTLVSSLIDNGGAVSNYTDADNDSPGIAITAINQGTLYYTTNGTNWIVLGAVSASSALILNSDADTRVYFKPNANVSGTITNAIAIKAWDRTSGTNGNTGVNTTVGTAFSTATDVVSINISGVNDDPAITGLPSDITVLEDVASNVNLSAATFNDVDAGSNNITLTLTAGAGTLSAIPGGGVTIGGSGTTTLVLTGTASNIDTYINTASNIDYSGVLNVNGTNATTLTLTANDGGNTGTGGGSDVTLGTVNVNITAVNDEPSFTVGVNKTVAQDAGAQSFSNFITNINDGDTEVGQTVSFSVSNNNNTLFAFQPAISSDGTLTFTPDATKFGKATVTVSISDDGGTANGGDNQSPDQTFNIFVTPVGITINELNSTPADKEFVELYNDNASTLILNGLVLVFFNGADDQTYKTSIDLDGYSVATKEFFVIGDAGVNSVDYSTGFSSGSSDIQDGPDAVALFVGDQSDFTVSPGTSATSDGLVDVVVYGSADDAVLRAALGGASLYDEDANGLDLTESLSRTPDGTPGFVAQGETPGTTNDVTPPTVSSVSVPSSATYITGQNLDFTVNFSEVVYVVTTGGTPYLTINLNTGGSVNAAYLSGSGTTALVFRYTVASGNEDIDGVTVGASITANGGTLKDFVGNAAILTLNSVASTSGVLVDAIAPVVTSVGVPANATYIAGQNLDFTVNYNEAVTVVTTGGTPYIAVTLNTGGTVNAAYQSGSGTTALVFRYTIVSGNDDHNGVTVGALSANGGTLKDAAGNNAALTLNSVASTTNVLVDALAPTVVSVAVPSSATYITGQNLYFTVTYSENITVVTSGGTPYIPVTLNTGGVVNATYQSGSGTAALVFRYTVASGNEDTDGISVGASIIANGGTLKDFPGNNATLSLNSVGSTSAVLVDAIAPTITSVGVPSDATYITGQNLDFTVNCGEAVTVNTTGGTPYIPVTLNTGGTVNASYQSGSGTTALVFRYMVVSGDEDTNGITVGASITSNGGTLKDAAGNDALLTLNSVGSTTGVLVDAIAPTVSSVSVPLNATYVAGQNLDFTVNCSEAVTVTTIGGTPYIPVTLNTGGTVNASYQSGSGTTALVFTYTVASGNEDTDGIAVGASITANGGTLKDAAGNNATLTLANVGSTASVLVDAIDPTVFNVTSTKSDGTYGIGEEITITVEFDEAVAVTGTPQLALETGFVDRFANYSSGTGTNTLNFTYTAQSGDESDDLDYKANNSLTLNGGTIKDAAGNNAILTLATPGAANSLGANKSIEIHAFPSVTLSVSPSSIIENGGTSTITATLSQISSQDVTVSLFYSGTATNGTDYNATASTSITVPAGSISANAATGITATQDLAPEGHETIIVEILSVTKGFEIGDQKQTITILDDDIATVSSVSSSTADGSYNAGDVIDLTVTFTHPVTVTGTPQLTLETGTTDETIDYTGGSGTTTLTFSYTVQAGDESADLDYVDVNSLSVTGGSIQNSGLDAILTLPTPGAAGSLGASKSIVIDTEVPTATITLSDYALKAGETATVTITFSEKVTGFDNTDLVIPNGTLTPVASTDGDITFTGTFTPNADVEDATNIISLNNTLVADLAGNAGTGTTSSSNFAIDTKIPVVANVTSTKIDGTYGIGETMLISVEFDQAVTVTGTPQLGLETGVVDRTINYVSGTNTNTLVFSYTAGAGDESADLDYNATSSLTLNGGTIADAAGNNAIRTLPALGAAGSLGANKAIVIEAFPLVTLGVGSTSIDENGGTASITATLSEISTQDVVVSVSYSGSAANGTDYNNTASTSITVPAGSTSASAVVGITATTDDIVETNETIIIDIASVSKGFENGAQQQTVTITDDDQAIISIEATTQASEDATNGVFTISVDKKLSTDLTVDLTLSGTAANGLDMNTMATSVLIPAGSFLVTTPVTLINDAIAEGSETVILTLGTNTGAPTGVTASNSTTDDEATVTITDNDLAVEVSIVATTQAAEDATNGLFTISVDKKLSTSLTVNLVPSGTATDGVDMSTMATSVVIPAGDFFVTTPVNVISDNLVEGDETVIYILGTKSGAPTGVTVTNSLTADKDTVTITDDDLATLRVTRKANAYENVSDGAFYVITNKRFDSDVNVGVSVGGTATAGTDYTAIVSPQLFPANTDTLTVTVAQLDDSESEINEYVILNLVSTNNARVSIAPAPDFTATVTIFDDDQPLVVLSQSATSFSESGGKNAITATLNKVHHTNVVVTLATTGTSTPGNDFSSVATITVPAGNLSATDTLRAIHDQLVEADETVVIDILSITNGVENGTQRVSSTIIDDDEAVLSISSAKNGKEGSSNAVFHVVTDKLIDSGVTVNVATSGTATEGVDYATFGGAITFPAYTDTFDVSVLITNDIDTEDAESVIMALVATSNADVTIAPAPNQRDTVTIVDDDIRQLVIANTVLTTSKIYDGNDIAKVVVGTLTNLIPGDNIVLKAEAHYDNADAGNKKKITIHYTVTGEDSIKYFAPVDSVYLKGLIEPGYLNIFAEDKTVRYGDSIPELTIRYEFFDTVGVVSDLDHQITAWVNTDSITGPGTYPIHLSGGKDDNYAIFYFEGTLTIEKALLKVTAQDKSITYGEPLPELTYTIEGFLNGDKDSVLTSMPTIAAATGAGENAGVFAIMPSGGSDEFYDFDYQNGKLMVAKAMLTATASDMVSSVGTIPQLTVGYAGFVKGDTSSELDTLPVATTTATKDSPSGAYPIKVSGGYDNNYNFTYVGGELTLASKANPTITWNTPSDIVYGELLGDKQLNATCNAYGTLVYEPAAGTLLGAGDMQELKVTFIPKDTINVNKASATVHIDVERATITVTANDKTITYGEILPVLSFSYSAFMNGENASVLDKRPSASTMVGVTDAGTYPIVLFGGEDDNYKFEYINGELTIEKAKLTVDVADCEMFEGDALPVFALSYSGFISGESATVLDTLPKATTQVITESAPGIYEVIAAGGKDNNYSFVYEKGNLTVKAKQHPVVTWANPSDITYGTVLGATQLNAKANIAGTFTYTPSTGTVLAAGKSQLVIARFTPTDIANYAVVTDTALINVSKAPLTVTADDAEMKAGETMPEFTMSYAGFVNGDDKSDIDKQPVATSTASSTSEKGEYEITVLGGEDNNYSFIYVSGTLTIKSGDAVKVIEAMSLSVYPNPFTDQVSITADYKGLGSYQLSDITGKVIEQGNIANGTGNLKLSHIRSGVYLLQVKMGEGCKSFRLIKR